MNVWFNYIFLVLLLVGKERKMCDILRKIKDKTPEELLRDYYHHDDAFSVDIVEIATDIGINLSGVDFSKMEESEAFKEKVEKSGRILGAVYVKDNLVDISYSTILSHNKSEFESLSDEEKKEKLIRRQRFTIAHEIAHCCLHFPIGDGSHIEYRTEQEDNSNKKEREANIFAGELLMPTKTMLWISKMMNYKLSIVLLSDLFRVSKHVVRARIEYLKEKDILPSTTIIYGG